MSRIIWWRIGLAALLAAVLISGCGGGSGSGSGSGSNNGGENGDEDGNGDEDEVVVIDPADMDGSWGGTLYLLGSGTTDEINVTFDVDEGGDITHIEIGGTVDSRSFTNEGAVSVNGRLLHFVEDGGDDWWLLFDPTVNYAALISEANELAVLEKGVSLPPSPGFGEEDIVTRWDGLGLFVGDPGNFADSLLDFDLDVSFSAGDPLPSSDDFELSGEEGSCGPDDVEIDNFDEDYGIYTGTQVQACGGEDADILFLISPGSERAFMTVVTQPSDGCFVTPVEADRCVIGGLLAE